MIVLHSGETVQARIGQLIENTAGDTFRNDNSKRLPEYLEEIERWMSSTTSPEVVVIDPAEVASDVERAAYESLRRMAKFKGVDVHLVGDSSVEFVADRHVTRDEDMAIIAPGSDAGADAARLVAGEEMTPFERVELDIPSVEEVMKSSGWDQKTAQEHVTWMKGQAVYANNLYQVNVEFIPGGRAHLIIRRLDKQAVHSWQHFQQIKNEILGPECEAVELYPKESNLIDEKHHYHLWGLRSPEASFGIGFKTGRQVG